jgi:hypothetical protein
MEQKETFFKLILFDMTPAEKCKLFIAALEKVYKQFGYDEIVFIVYDSGHLIPGFAHDPDNPGKSDVLMSNVFVKVVDTLRSNSPFDNLELHSTKEGEWENTKLDGE